MKCPADLSVCSPCSFFTLTVHTLESNTSLFPAGEGFSFSLKYEYVHYILTRGIPLAWVRIYGTFGKFKELHELYALEASSRMKTRG